MEQENLAGIRILVVEDNEFNREIAHDLLEDMGAEVIVVSDGADAVETVRSTPAGQIDLILMDIQMPGMDGYKATELIRNMEDETKAHIPIIAMTAYAFEEDKKKALAVGMNGHMAKPVRPRELWECVIKNVR